MNPTELHKVVLTCVDEGKLEARWCPLTVKAMTLGGPLALWQNQLLISIQSSQMVYVKWVDHRN